MKLNVDLSELHKAVAKMTTGNTHFQLKKTNKKPNRDQLKQTEQTSTKSQKS